MFTPKLEVVEELKIPLTTTTFSPTLLADIECNVIPQSKENPLNEKLFEELEKLHPGEFHQGIADILRIYGHIVGSKGVEVILKSRMDWVFDIIFETLYDSIGWYEGDEPKFLLDIISKEDIDAIGIKESLDNYYDCIFDYYRNKYSDKELFEIAGLEINGETENLYSLTTYN